MLSEAYELGFTHGYFGWSRDVDNLSEDYDIGFYYGAMRRRKNIDE